MLVTIERMISGQEKGNSTSSQENLLSHNNTLNKKSKLLINASTPLRSERVYETYLTVKGAAFKIPSTQSHLKYSNSYMGDIELHLKQILKLLRDEDSLALAVRLDSNIPTFDPCCNTNQSDIIPEPTSANDENRAATPRKYRYLVIISSPAVLSVDNGGSPDLSHATKYLILGIDAFYPTTDPIAGGRFSVGLVLPFEPRSTRVNLDGDGGLLIDVVEEYFNLNTTSTIETFHSYNYEGATQGKLGRQQAQQHYFTPIPEGVVIESNTTNPHASCCNSNVSSLARMARQHHHYFKPISVQAMWAAVQCLYKILHEKVVWERSADAGLGLREEQAKISYDEWLRHYRLGGHSRALTADALAFREWHTLAPADESSSSKLYYDLALETSTIPPSAFFLQPFYKNSTHSDKQSITAVERDELPLKSDSQEENQDINTETSSSWMKFAGQRQAIKECLKDIMTAVDLEDVTCRFIRNRLESQMGPLLSPNLKSFVDEQVMIILGQMETSTKIFDYLYLGSEWNASNLDELKNNGIGYILNVTKEVENFFPDLFIYQNIRISDHENSDLLPHWDTTYKFINKARRSGSKVLIHCKMGVSRSASTVLAYIMKRNNCSLSEAIDFLAQKRTCVKPNEGFLNQLQIYQGILEANQNKQKLIWRSKSEINIKKSYGGVESMEITSSIKGKYRTMDFQDAAQEHKVDNYPDKLVHPSSSITKKSHSFSEMGTQKLQNTQFSHKSNTTSLSIPRFINKKKTV